MSNNPSVDEFVWPGAWLTAGGRADGRAAKPQSNGARFRLVTLEDPAG